MLFKAGFWLWVLLTALMLCGAGCRYRDPPSVWICTDIDREYLKYLDTVPLDKMKPGEFHNYAEIASRCRCEVRDE